MTQLLVIVAYLTVLLILGAVAGRFFKGTSDDYMLASHSIGPFLLLMSLFGTTMTAFALIGSTGRSYTLGVGVYGLLASAGGIVHSLCFFIIGIPLWAIGRRNGYRTQIQFFRERLDNQIIGFLLFPILVALVITYLLLGVVGAGFVVNQVTVDACRDVEWFENSGDGVPRPVASACICLVVMLYVFLGGMRGTAWANALQTTIFMILGVVTFVTIANALGGTESLFDNLKFASHSVPEVNLGREKIPPAVYFSFLFIPLSVAMFPHVFQHWLTAKSASAFKLPIIMHPIFIMIVWAPCVLIGIWASSEISAIPEGTQENMILAMLVQKHAGHLLGGLLTAGILAAILSSLDSQFLCVGTMFAEDIVRDSMDAPYDDRTMVWVTRIFVVSIVVVTFILSLLLPRAVFDLGIWSFSGFTGLFPLVFAAIYWQRLTAAGAISSVIVTAVSWIVLFWRSDFGANKRYAFPEGPISLGVVDIPPMLPVVSILLLSTAVLVGVSLITTPPNQKVIDRFFKRDAWKKFDVDELYPEKR